MAMKTPRDVKHRDSAGSANISRRALLKSALALGAAGGLPGISWASSAIAGDKRMVLIILRGAMDGLAAVIPYGDPNLQLLRGDLLPADSALHKLDSHFALHPALTNLRSLHQQQELGIFHAVATPYRERSHFDGQNVLENGSQTPQTHGIGWLNRALQIQPNQQAMAIGQSVPLILRGSHAVGSWAPPVLPPVSDDTLNRLQSLYHMDDFLGPRLQQALLARDIVGDSVATGAGFSALVSSAVNFLNAPTGPNVVVLEKDGWDTHANQGAEQGTLARQFSELDDAIGQLKSGLGTNWRKTVVVVATEFGRTVRVNGSLGTDHGTGGVAFMAGGELAGMVDRQSVIQGVWPGLADGQLYEGRDLQGTSDVRDIFRTVLQQHLGFNQQLLDEFVFVSG